MRQHIDRPLLLDFWLGSPTLHMVYTAITGGKALLTGLILGIHVYIKGLGTKKLVAQ